MAKVGRLVKESTVQEVSTRLSERPNFFVMTVNRLPASNADIFRQKLYASQAHLVVVNRRLGQRALQALNIAGLAELLEGSVGLVLSGGDTLQTAKLIVEFRKTHEDEFAVRGAVIDGQLLDKGTVEQLASLPPKPVLLAQLVATIESPMANLIFTIEQLIGDLAWTIEQTAAKKPPETKSTETPTTEAGTTAQAVVADGSAERRSRRPTEASTPPAAESGGTTPQQEGPTS